MKVVIHKQAQERKYLKIEVTAQLSVGNFSRSRTVTALM